MCGVDGVGVTPGVGLGCGDVGVRDVSTVNYRGEGRVERDKGRCLGWAGRGRIGELRESMVGLVDWGEDRRVSKTDGRRRLMEVKDTRCSRDREMARAYLASLDELGPLKWDVSSAGVWTL